MSLRPAVGLFFSEIKLITGRAVEVWRMVPRQFKWAFLAATGIMSLGSAAAIGIPLLLGWLIDTMAAGASERGMAW